MDNATKELTFNSGFTAAYASVCRYDATDDVELAWAAYAAELEGVDVSDTELDDAFVAGWREGIRDARLC